jgi:hypothetical protein
MQKGTYFAKDFHRRPQNQRHSKSRLVCKAVVGMNEVFIASLTEHSGGEWGHAEDSIRSIRTSMVGSSPGLGTIKLQDAPSPRSHSTHPTNYCLHHNLRFRPCTARIIVKPVSILMSVQQEV